MMEKSTDSVGRLFPEGLVERTWTTFPADGYDAPVPGLIYRAGNPPTNGMPLGGLDTGCLDLGADGTLGYASIFNSHCWRRGPLNMPFLGLSIGKDSWLLSTLKLKNDPEGEVYDLHRFRAKPAAQIDYWGHYPIADMEFETDAPVSAGLRAWAPFIPGDTAVSNTPGSVFEVRLRNRTAEVREGRLVFSFPGPSPQEVCGNNLFTHTGLTGKITGVDVANSDGIGYVLGVIGSCDHVLTGGDLGVDGGSWSHFAETGRIHLSLRWRLPYATLLPPEAQQAGASLAVPYRLGPGEGTVVRFVLAWYSPEWRGVGNPMAGGRTFRHMYASRYRNALDVAQYLATHHQTILARIMAWQQVIYGDEKLPGWLRELLVNNFHLFPEDSLWAQARPPIGDWCRKEDGLFAMNDGPRSCSDMGTNSEQIYGATPTVYFFPELMLSTLRAYKAYQTHEGAVPFMFGGVVFQTAPCDLVEHNHAYMVTMNGAVYADLLDRLWLRTGDDAMLHEFYDSLKLNLIYTMDLNRGPDGVVSMPDRLVSSVPGYERETEWFEFCEWRGIVPHVGGIHLAQVALVRRMAERVGDTAFAAQCQEWITQGQRALEEKTWNGDSYLTFLDEANGRKSDAVFSNQLDGQWLADFHGLTPVFPEARIQTTLQTVQRLNPPTDNGGIVHFSGRDGKPAVGGAELTPGAHYSAYDYFPSELLIYGATCLYRGDREYGLAICRACMEHIACTHGRSWDMPNIINGKTGEILFGDDYYQMMMVWSLVAAVEGGDLAGPCRPGGLVDRVIAAGRQQD